MHIFKNLILSKNRNSLLGQVWWYMSQDWCWNILNSFWIIISKNILEFILSFFEASHLCVCWIPKPISHKCHFPALILIIYYLHFTVLASFLPVFQPIGSDFSPLCCCCFFYNLNLCKTFTFKMFFFLSWSLMLSLHFFLVHCHLFLISCIVNFYSYSKDSVASL